MAVYKNRRALLAVLPLLPLGVDALLTATGGAHDPRNLIWGPIFLVGLAPLALWLVRKTESRHGQQTTNGRIHVVRSSRTKGR